MFYHRSVISVPFFIRTILLTCLVGAGLLLLANAAAAQTMSATASACGTAQDSAPVTLYQHDRFRGCAASLGVGQHTLADISAAGLGNDQMTSLKVNNGYTVTLYWDDNFQGGTLVETADNSNIGSIWNDEVSSVVVEEVGSSPVPPPAPDSDSDPLLGYVFTPGAKVKTTDELNVRVNPSLLAQAFRTVGPNTVGTIVSGPHEGANVTWYKVKYYVRIGTKEVYDGGDTGIYSEVEGWSASEYLDGCTTCVIPDTTPPVADNPPVGPDPTCTLDADRTSIDAGDEITLEWGTQNATDVNMRVKENYELNGDMGIAIPASGSDTFSPDKTETWQIVASNEDHDNIVCAEVPIIVDGDAPAEDDDDPVEISVMLLLIEQLKDMLATLIAQVTGETPPQSESNLAVGDEVKTLDTLSVRETPAGTLIRTVPSGTPGTIVGGPSTADGLTWWKVEYTDGDLVYLNGWSAGQYLEKVGDSPTSGTGYSLDDVSSVVEQSVDPIPDAADDEYTLYTITLKGGNVVQVKAYSFIAPSDVGFDQAFYDSGYNGDVDELIALADLEGVVPGSSGTFSARPESGNAPLLVFFDVNYTGQGGAAIIDFGDGELTDADTCFAPSDQCVRPGTNAHLYSKEGNYTAKLIRESDGEVLDEVKVEIGSPCVSGEANCAQDGDIAIQQEFDAAVEAGTAAELELFITRHPDHALANEAQDILDSDY